VNEQYLRLQLKCWTWPTRACE